MTRPGIEPRSSGPLANNLLIRATNLLLFFSFFYYEMYKVEWRRDSEMAKFAYTQGRRCSFSVKPFFLSSFTRLVQSQFKTSNHLSFYMFFNFKAFAKQPFFLQGSYQLSTLASLFLGTTLFRASSIISRYLIILASLF